MTLLTPTSRHASGNTEDSQPVANEQTEENARAASSIHTTPPCRFWLGATPPHALVETLLIAAAVSLIAYLLIYNPSRFGLAQFTINLILLDGPFCALWCALRLRLSRGTWQRQYLHDSTMGAILGLVPFGVLLVTALSLASSERSAANLLRVGVRGIPIAAFFLIALVAFMAEFVVFRIGVRLLLFWNRLRRTRLQWALTHAHLVVAAIGAGLLILLVVTLLHVTSSGPGRSIITVVPLLFFLSVLSVLGIIIVLPPSALFSFIFARSMTRRLQTLTTATNALRAGDYAVRVPITGEDEVAQLQANFNAMAADLQRAVEQVEAERDTIAQLLTARRELIASVSHELRTPVATLRGYLESTVSHWNGTPPTTLRADLEVMERETIHLQALINDLFTLARAEVGKLDLYREPVDMGALVRRIAATQAPLAWQRGRVEVVADAPSDPQLALADAGRLEQVVQNLLHNAIRHTPPGGIVALAVAPDPDNAGMVRLQVNDTGEGIAEEDVPYIWERFYRGQTARTEGGTGLGLALVKELTEAMNGTVAVESTLGRGSCFTIRLPRSELQPARL
ncbi:MAG TPA: ATP-binding protein [Ktedonobacterales bacterium]